METLPIRRNLATASLVLGILGIVGCFLQALVSVGLVPFVCLLLLFPIVTPFSGLVGLVLGIVALAKALRRPLQYKGKASAITGICTSLVSLAGIFAIYGILEPWGRSLELRSVCSANLYADAVALEMYAKEHSGQYPSDVDALLAGNLAAPRMLVCPYSEAWAPYDDACSNYKAGDPVPSEVHEAIHSCYVYIRGQGPKGDARNVLMCDKKECHRGRGGNVLFADGHREWVEPYSKVEELIAQTKQRLAASTRPASEGGNP